MNNKKNETTCEQGESSQENHVIDKNHMITAESNARPGKILGTIGSQKRVQWYFK